MTYDEAKIWVDSHPTLIEGTLKLGGGRVSFRVWCGNTDAVAEGSGNDVPAIQAAAWSRLREKLENSQQERLSQREDNFFLSHSSSILELTDLLVETIGQLCVRWRSPSGGGISEEGRELLDELFPGGELRRADAELLGDLVGGLALLDDLKNDLGFDPEGVLFPGHRGSILFPTCALVEGSAFGSGLSSFRGPPYPCWAPIGRSRVRPPRPRRPGPIQLTQEL